MLDSSLFRYHWRLMNILNIESLKFEVLGTACCTGQVPGVLSRPGATSDSLCDRCRKQYIVFYDENHLGRVVVVSAST